MVYFIVLCKYCGNPRYVKEGENGFKCMKCHKYMKLNEVRIIAKVESVKDAVYIVKELKLPEELRGKIKEN